MLNYVPTCLGLVQRGINQMSNRLYNVSLCSARHAQQRSEASYKMRCLNINERKTPQFVTNVWYFGTQSHYLTIVSLLFVWFGEYQQIPISYHHSYTSLFMVRLSILVVTYVSGIERCTHKKVDNLISSPLVPCITKNTYMSTIIAAYLQ
jgi:hypothetical protein